MSENNFRLSEKNLMILVRLIAGLVLVFFYVVTGMDGVILAFAAFLFGIPSEYAVKYVLNQREDG